MFSKEPAVRTGADCLVETLVNAGVDTCFANPGTSEMQMVAALGLEPRLKPVLCLFEGVVTGAADGYARMTGRPAVTLLHLGPGLANGLANLHNAKKAGSTIINVIGDHTTFHKVYDAPLNSDIEATAAPYSHWVHTVKSLAGLPGATVDAISAALAGNGQIASLILPADFAWSALDALAGEVKVEARALVPADLVQQARKLLTNGKKTGIILHGAVLQGEGLMAMGRIAAATGATLLAPYASSRIERGAGLPELVRIPFPVDAAVSLLAPFEQLLLVGAKEPVAFFAYPGKPSRMAAPGTELLVVGQRDQDLLQACLAIENSLGCAAVSALLERPCIPPSPTGPITSQTLAAVVARALTDGTILVDEGVTSSREVFNATKGSPRHDLLVNVGGSIGAGLPLALGAAVACPDHPVLCLSGDGSASYTLQALWSMAQQKLNVTTIICANHDYAILKGEMVRVGAMTPDSPPNPLLELINPKIDWVTLANGFGVSAQRVANAEALESAIRDAMDSSGPHLIEAVM